VEFARFANRLRVSGVIVGCSREDQLNAHHDQRRGARRDNGGKALQAGPDRAAGGGDRGRRESRRGHRDRRGGAAYVHTVQQYGTEEYASFTKPTGKGDYSPPREELFAELGEALAHLDADAVILAGPGFTKQDALDYITEEYRDLADRITTVDTSAAAIGASTRCSSAARSTRCRRTRISKEATLIDDLTAEIAQGAKATYGPEDVAEEAAEFGAIETLLVVDDRLRTERQGEGDWSIDVNEVIESVEQQGGDVVVFSSEFAPANSSRTSVGSPRSCAIDCSRGVQFQTPLRLKRLVAERLEVITRLRELSVNTTVQKSMLSCCSCTSR